MGEDPVKIDMPSEMITCKIPKDGNDRDMIVCDHKFRPLMQGLSLHRMKL